MCAREGGFDRRGRTGPSSGTREGGYAVAGIAGKDPKAVAVLDSAILRVLLTESPLGVHIVDRDLRLVRFNVAAPGARGAVGQEAIGRRMRDVAPELVDEAAEGLAQQVLDTGRPVADVEITGCPPSDPGHRHVYSVSAFRLQDPDGGVLGVLIASTDVTERHRARARLDLLAEASRRIGTTLDVMTTAGELAAVAVPDLADVTAVDMIDDVLDGEAPPAGPVGARTTLRRAGFQSAEGPPARLAYGIGEANVSYPASFTQCLADLRSRLVARLETDSEWAAHDPRRAELIRQAGAHSLMVVPLTARGVVLGLASFYRTTTADPFDDDDLTLAEELTARAAVYVDNARRYARERTAAPGAPPSPCTPKASCQPTNPDPELGLAHLRRVLANPYRALDDTCDAAVHALAPNTSDDDIVLLLGRTRTLDADQVATWTLPSDPAIVTTARTLTDKQLNTWNLEELAFTTELIVSEPVTNAIRYGTGSIQLRLIRDLNLICEVSDGSSTAPHLRYAHASDEGGRGLLLVAQLARRWGTRYAARGKTLWAEQALTT